EMTMGDKAVAIGYPLGMGLSTSEGIVSGLNRTLNVELSAGGSASMTLIQTDAAINPGNSGGPLINEYGQVVGITSSKLVNNSIEGMGFAIPITDAMPLISDLMNKGYVVNRTPQIGITGSDINTAMMRYYNLPVDKGVMVVSVTEGSGAEAAGICAGDVIVAADGKDIATMTELTAAKSGKEIGDTMILTLARADGNIDITITLTGEDDIPAEKN
ncbi:MAG: PDZ domain-containing protein, partial [Oscillospiraceae bacterium]|nr:PDZ domain-containing protein [Oscillospiraceae bacterium]